ncbi:hypothetical protein D3C74_437310 [compost metagenome]
MRVTYLDNDGGEELFYEDREDIIELLAILNSNGKINLRWLEDKSYVLAKFDEAILDIAIDSNGEKVEVLLIYFDVQHSK